ncbi:MAG: hypothetical protein UT33_C0011G0132 [Candidatus Peregrinibacteria bacterium GW2011_GWC2_39_14]|nr:MAG: hypothetical protein UT33_C0011G0132 [Candidatus Peregrinibacteria bacterium GW2011_GWC2_39_14]
MDGSANVPGNGDEPEAQAEGAVVGAGSGSLSKRDELKAAGITELYEDPVKVHNGYVECGTEDSGVSRLVYQCTGDNASRFVTTFGMELRLGGYAGFTKLSFYALGADRPSHVVVDCDTGYAGAVANCLYKSSVGGVTRLHSFYKKTS